MKAKLLVHLKTDAGVIAPGKVFDDSVEPFPEYITNNLGNGNIVSTEGESVKVVKEEKPSLKKPSLLKPAK